MPTEHSFGHETTAVTLCGTALTVGVNISSPDIYKTIVLAALGALVSFTVSRILKWFISKLRK